MHDAYLHIQRTREHPDYVIGYPTTASAHRAAESSRFIDALLDDTVEDIRTITTAEFQELEEEFTTLETPKAHTVAEAA